MFLYEENNFYELICFASILTTKLDIVFRDKI